MESPLTRFLTCSTIMALVVLSYTGAAEAGVTCLESPQTFCDFIFTGDMGAVQNYKGVPNFNLIRKGDHTYGSPIIHKSGLTVVTLNTDGVCQFVPFSMPSAGLSCVDNFYFKNNLLSTRTFQKQEPVELFQNMAIRLYFSSVELRYPNDTALNLNKDDEKDRINLDFPVNRRCVVFTTNTDVPTYIG